MTQSDVAKRANITQSSLSMLEHAGSATSITTLERYVRAMGCKLKVMVRTPMGDEIELDCAPFYNVEMIELGRFTFKRRRSKEQQLMFTLVEGEDGRFYVTGETGELSIYTEVDKFLDDNRIRLDSKNKVYLQKCLHTAKFAV